MLHVVILRSPLPHGRLKSMDVTAAPAIQGVHAVITAADLDDGIPCVPLHLMDWLVCSVRNFSKC